MYKFKPKGSILYIISCYSHICTYSKQTHRKTKTGQICQQRSLAVCRVHLGGLQGSSSLPGPNTGPARVVHAYRPHQPSRHTPECIWSISLDVLQLENLSVHYSAL